MTATATAWEPIGGGTPRRGQAVMDERTGRIVTVRDVHARGTQPRTVSVVEHDERIPIRHVMRQVQA